MLIAIGLDFRLPYTCNLFQVVNIFSFTIRALKLMNCEWGQTLLSRHVLSLDYRIKRKRDFEEL